MNACGVRRGGARGRSGEHASVLSFNHDVEALPLPSAVTLEGKLACLVAYDPITLAPLRRTNAGSSDRELGTY